MKVIKVFTPEEVVKNDDMFGIPIYQRLFEWNKESIEKLLADLVDAMTRTLVITILACLQQPLTKIMANMSSLMVSKDLP